MPDDLGIYESSDVLLVDGFQCLGGKTFDDSPSTVVLGMFSGTRDGRPSRSDVMIPVSYAPRVAKQMIDIAEEVMHR